QLEKRLRFGSHRAVRVSIAGRRNTRAFWQTLPGSRPVPQHHAETLLRLCEYQLVCFRGALEWKFVCDQGGDLHQSRGKKTNKLLQVASIGPSHITDRVIMAL